MRLELPWPPSANRRLVPARGRWVTAPAYRAWQERAAEALLHWPTYKGNLWIPSDRLAVFIEACPPDNRRRDLDGLIKAPLDALVRARIVADDSTRHITHVACYLGPVVKGGLLRVTIESDTETPGR